MAIVMLTDKNRFSYMDQSITGLVLLLVLGATALLLLGARRVHRVIGNAGAQIISRVMGLILSAVALNNLYLPCWLYRTQSNGALRCLWIMLWRSAPFFY
ncbi:multiple antibiotic resistance protein marC [Vibrio sp. JCM 19236]|nr:multiple antibiotic resistance protein marC [Vibrio sp. JCM 19236]